MIRLRLFTSIFVLFTKSETNRNKKNSRELAHFGVCTQYLPFIYLYFSIGLSMCVRLMQNLHWNGIYSARMCLSQSNNKMEKKRSVIRSNKWVRAGEWVCVCALFDNNVDNDDDVAMCQSGIFFKGNVFQPFWLCLLACVLRQRHRINRNQVEKKKKIPLDSNKYTLSHSHNAHWTIFRKKI